MNPAKQNERMTKRTEYSKEEIELGDTLFNQQDGDTKADNKEPKPTICTLKARSKQIIQINLIDPKINEGYLSRFDVRNSEIYIGEVIVNNNYNHCNVIVINT